MIFGKPALPQLIEEGLNKRLQLKDGRKIKVVSFASVSSIAYQDTIRYLYEAADYEPDMVVFYGGGNDLLAGLVSQENRPGYPHRYKFFESNPLWLTSEGSKLRLAKTSYPVLELVLFNFKWIRDYFAEYLKEKLILNAEHQFSVGGLIKESTALAYLDALKKAVTVAKGYGHNIVLILQPSAVSSGMKSQQKMHSEKEASRWDGAQKSYSEASSQFNGLAKLSCQNTCAALNLSEFFLGGDMSIFRYLIHLEQSAREMVSLKVIDHLAKQINGMYLTNEKSR